MPSESCYSTESSPSLITTTWSPDASMEPTPSTSMVQSEQMLTRVVFPSMDELVVVGAHHDTAPGAPGASRLTHLLDPTPPLLPEAVEPDQLVRGENRQELRLLPPVEIDLRLLYTNHLRQDLFGRVVVGHVHRRMDVHR